MACLCTLCTFTYCSHYRRRINVHKSVCRSSHKRIRLTDGHVVFCLIRKCYLAKTNNTDLVVLGSGRPLRQFIYNKDLARLIFWAIRDYAGSAPVILSGSEEVSIADVSLAVAEAFSFTGNIIFDTSKSDGQYKKTASNKKLMSYLPHFKLAST